MDYKKTNAPLNTVTRDMIELSAVLEKKLQEFASLNDNLEEISENREQIEISRYYEKLPKPTLIATQEYVDHKLFFRNPMKERDSQD